VFGAFVGGGVDLRLTNRIFLNVDGGYRVLPDLANAIGGKKNYGGAEITVGIGWQFGKPVPVQNTP
jgi:hypothetical protein